MADRLDQGSYQIVWVPCRNLSVVWVQSQRKFSPYRAKQIAENFDPELLDPVKVTMPNGNGVYHICDGQTRKAAIESLWGPEEMVPCLVAPEGDPQRAAELFLRTNTSRKPPTIIDNFKVSVTARHPTEVDIDKIVRRNKYRVDSSGGKDVISAVTALKHVYTQCGSMVLDQTLRMLRETWGDDAHAVGGNLIRGFGQFLNEFGSYANHQRLLEVIKKRWTPGTLIRDANSKHELDGIPVPDAIVDHILRQYNKGLRAGKPLQRKQAVNHDRGKPPRQQPLQ